MTITARIEFEISNTFDEWEQSFYSMQNEASLWPLPITRAL
jgi:hypothetical protein